jgi:hypothetical protein
MVESGGTEQHFVSTPDPAQHADGEQHQSLPVVGKRATRLIPDLPTLID